MTEQKIHSFEKSKAVGIKGELIVKDYLESINYFVSPLTIKEQKKYGYDFRVRNLITDKVYGVEVKTDVASQRTGNIFIETHVDRKPGWFIKYPKNSKIIMVFLIKEETFEDTSIYKMLFVSVSNLRKLDMRNYPRKKVRNENYMASGHIVPIQEIAALSMIRRVVI